MDVWLKVILFCVFLMILFNVYKGLMPEYIYICIYIYYILYILYIIYYIIYYIYHIYNIYVYIIYMIYIIYIKSFFNQ